MVLWMEDLGRPQHPRRKFSVLDGGSGVRMKGRRRLKHAEQVVWLSSGKH